MVWQPAEGGEAVSAEQWAEASDEAAAHEEAADQPSRPTTEPLSAPVASATGEPAEVSGPEGASP
jgi:hypothetical protein